MSYNSRCQLLQPTIVHRGDHSMASVVSTALPTDWTLADMLVHLGGIPLERIRMYPPPGMATEKDVLRAKSRFNRICELIDGVLVADTAEWPWSSANAHLSGRDDHLAKATPMLAMVNDWEFVSPSLKEPLESRASWRLFWITCRIVCVHSTPKPDGGFSWRFGLG